MDLGKNAACDHIVLGFDRYQAVRHRLPTPPRAGACHKAKNLAEITEHFDAVLLDAFGVLNIGQAVVPGSPERIAALQAMGKRALVVSNAAGFPHSAIVTRLGGLGYQFDADDIITSRKALLAGLANETPRHWGMAAGEVFGPEEFGDLSFTRLKDEPAAYEQAEGFLLVGASAWDTSRQDRLVESLNARPRPFFVANPDLMAPQENGFSTEPGHFGHDIAERTGIEPVFYGKPFTNIFELAISHLGKGFDPSRILMVGDTLHTDILGGLAAGIQTALVVDTGVLAGSDINAAIERSGIAPDWIIDRP